VNDIAKGEKGSGTVGAGSNGSRLTNTRDTEGVLEFLWMLMLAVQLTL
jgi:hypothetical protein